MKRLVVGLTGGIAAGKTLALEEFSRLGAATVSSDRLAHELSRKGMPAYRRILGAFGKRVLRPDGELDRRKLAGLVFASPARRRRLERLTHPLILREIFRRVSRAGRGVVVVDVPLLFEGGHESRFDLTLLVSSSRRTRLARVTARDGLSLRAALKRFSAQMPAAEKERRADVVVHNDGSRGEFLRRIKSCQQAFALIQHGGR